MKPHVEHVSNQDTFTLRLENYTGGYCEFDWHYHWVYELVLHRNHSGRLFAGAYVHELPSINLALFGPRLPHTNILSPRNPKKSALTRVLWFSPSWVDGIATQLPEFQPLSQLLQQSLRGLLFNSELASLVDSLLENFHLQSAMRQSSTVLQILVELAEQGPTLELNPGLAILPNEGERNDKKLERIARFIDRNYRTDIELKDLAEHLHISRSGVQRIFKRQFLQSFSEHLAQYRIGKACELLVNTDFSVALICDEVGFSNLSNFNRQFKKIKNMTPTAFRGLFQRSS